MAKILGIETSCDETSASVCIDGKIINNEIITQSIHQQYGGVVPELASREHLKNIVPMVDLVIKNAEIQMKDLHAVAYTRGPGLLGALLVGSCFAKALASVLDFPMVPVHHLKAHVLAHFIDDPKPGFPFICLTVSGGHTQLVRVDAPDQMKVVGQTMDDAAGEAFDKSAILLGLSYPGGPMIDKLAANGNPHRFHFGRTEAPGLDYSFSGIKTSILYFLRKEMREDKHFIKNNLHDLAAAIQRTLVDMLVEKLEKAVVQESVSRIAIAGGVAANNGLRSRLSALAMENDWELFVPDLQYCTDNAGMIAMAGHFLYESRQFGKISDSPLPGMSF